MSDVRQSRLRKFLCSPGHYSRLLACYLFGQSIGRLAYPSYIFRSRWFLNGPGAPGWSWVTGCFFTQKILGINRHVPWPCSSRVLCCNPGNIIFHPDDLNNFQTGGNYFQAIGKIHIGKGSYIAPNVGIITENHDLYDPDKRAGAKDVRIGKKCWIGMNAMVLPGVVLGDHTVVGGSVVTHSFPEGHCVIAGNPARIIKRIEVSDSL